MAVVTPQRRLLSTRAVGLRYGGKCPRTILRWSKEGVIPPPDQTINRWHFWDEAALDRHDRMRVAARARRVTPRETTDAA